MPILDGLQDRLPRHRKRCEPTGCPEIASYDAIQDVSWTGCMSASTPRLAAVAWPVFTVACISLLLALLVFVRPIDHDESQYVAAVALARHWSPYRDFDYLQTPLQPILFAPLLAVGSHHGLLTLRLANALLAAFAALLFVRVSRSVMTSLGWAWMGAALLATNEAFLFSASTARNDILPFVLYCAGLALLVQLPRQTGGLRSVTSMLIGLLLAGAAAAKISYCLPAASLLLVELSVRRRSRCLSIPCYLLGTMPMVALLAVSVLRAPMPALFDILVFPSRGPAEWYLAHGQGFWLSVAGRLLTLLKFLALGPAPVTIAATLAHREWSPPAIDEPTSGADAWTRRHFVGLLVAGMLAALLPAPLWRQYLLPMYPPLLLLTLPALRKAWRKWTWRGLTGLFCCAGFAFSAVQIWLAVEDGVPLLNFEHQAGMLGRLLREHGISGPVASLAPEFVVDAGGVPDPRFATGPFLFRTRDALGWTGWIVGTGARDTPSRLAQDPPAAIVTGGDAVTSGSAALERAFGRDARHAGFSPVATTDPNLTLWLPVSRKGGGTVGQRAGRRYGALN